VAGARGRAAESTTAPSHLRRGRAAALGQPLDAPRACSRDARPSRCVGPLRAAQAGDRRASGRDRRGSPSRRWPMPSGSTSSGRGGVARPEAAVRRAVRLGRGPRRRSRPRATSRCSARSCSPTRSTRPRSRSTIMPPSGNGTGSASSWSMPAARPGSTAAPATTFRAAFPTSPRRSDPGVLDGELLVRAGEDQGADAHGGAAASFNALQQRLGRKKRQRQDAGPVSGLRPALRHPVRRRRGSAPAAVDRAARAARAIRRRGSIPSASTCRS
jgi:hypothetical protein